MKSFLEREYNLWPSNKYSREKEGEKNVERSRAQESSGLKDLSVIIKTYYPADKIYVASFALFHAEKIYGFEVILRHFRFNVQDLRRS
jgi:hypothetical protein